MITGCGSIPTTSTVAYFAYLLFLRLRQHDICSGRTGGWNAWPGEHKSQGLEESDSYTVPEAPEATQGMYFFFSNLKTKFSTRYSLIKLLCQAPIIVKDSQFWLYSHIQYNYCTIWEQTMCTTKVKHMQNVELSWAYWLTDWLTDRVRGCSQ